MQPNSSRPVLSEVASLKIDTVYAENDNAGATPVLSVTANLNKMDLGRASTDVQKAIASLGKPPRGLTIQVKGLSEVLTDTLSSLQAGMLAAIAVIFLMLAANFQSFKMLLGTLCTVSAVLLGSLALLMVIGSTLKLQSFIGMIMVVGGFVSQSDV